VQRIAGASGSHGRSGAAPRAAVGWSRDDADPGTPTSARNGPAEPVEAPLQAPLEARLDEPGAAPPIVETPERTRPRSKLAAYVALTKPRIIELLLVTTVPTMILAQEGLPPLWLMAATVLGGTLAAGGANAVNMYVDRDIDRLMRRTVGRPLVTGEVTPRQALSFAVALEVAAFAWLWVVVNLLSAVLGLAACLFYVFVYTMWLKRSSTSNIVIGGAAGAVPVLVGWAAVQGSLAWTPVVLFAVIFFWTPPHFWALAIKYRDDYAAAEVPMLPVVAGLHRTALQIVGYTVVLWALTLLVVPVAGMGWLYTATALVSGAVFFGLAVLLLRAAPPRQPKLAMRVFSWSITYLMVLFAALAADQLVRSGF